MNEGEKKELGQIRREYRKDQLDETILPDDPLDLLASWLDQAQTSGIADPTAMTLSTVDREGQPSSRIVLLKNILEGKLIFYTNYRSRKAQQMETNPRIALLFFWSVLERQVKIAGRATPVDPEDSDLYFQSRPFESNVSTWASPQSEVVPDRSYLEKEFDKYIKKFSPSRNVPRPGYWGGYAITPEKIEFWQGGSHRLHDRIEYSRTIKGWSRVRLAP